MNCVIPSGAIRVFRDIIHCMASFGTEVILTCFPNQLILSIGDNIEAYICQFQLDANFFQAYDVTLNTSFNDTDMEEVSCRMNLESLEQIFQGIGTDEKLYDSLQIKLAPPNPNASTLIEDVTILFELKFVNGLSKINKLTYFDGSRVPLVRCDHSKWKNHASIPAKIILNWMKKFHTKGQDLLMIFQEDSLSLKTRESSLSTTGPGNWKLNTEFSLGVDDFVTYKVEPNSSLSFSAKDIKTLSKFAQSIKSDVDFYFSEDGSPINFEVKFSSIVTGKLYIPALNTYIEEGDQTYQDPNIIFTSGGIDFDKSSITEITIQSHFNSTPSQAQRSVAVESNGINLHSQAFTEGSFRMQEFSTHSNNQSQTNISTQESTVQGHQSNIHQKSNKRARDTPPNTKPQTHSHHITDSSENTSQHEARTNSQPLQKSDDPMTSGLSIGEGSDLSIQLPSSLPSFGNAIRNVISSTPTDSNANLNSVTPGQRQVNIIQTSSDSQVLEAKNDNYSNINEMGKVSISGEGDENEMDSEFGSDDEVPNTPPQKVFKLFDD